MHEQDRSVLQTALRELYVEHWPTLMAVSEDVPEISAPLLLSPPAFYLNQSTRLLVVGQETKGWCNGLYNDLEAEDAVVALMKAYSSWNFGGTTTFWQAVRELERRLNLPAHQFLWTNLNKIDVANGPPIHELAKTLIERVPILLLEIQLIKPDVVVFFSGPNYDWLLRLALPDVQFIASDNQYKANAFCRLAHPGLPVRSFRTYHPQYLRQSKLWKPIIDLLLRELETPSIHERGA